MKYISLLLTLMVLCTGSKVRILEATSQEWAGGLPESGYGTDYAVTFKAKGNSELLLIKGVWIDDLYLPVRVVNDPGIPGAKAFKRGDRLTVKGGLVYKPDDKGQVTLRIAEKRKKPVDYTGEGLLEYSYRGKTGYQEIKNFKILEKLIYP